MRLDAKGIAFLKAREGLRLTSYLDTKGVPTIGYGTTVYPSGAKVALNQAISLGVAEAFFQHDLRKFEDCVDDVIIKSPITMPNPNGEGTVTIPSTLTQNQFNALVALCYNIGESAFTKSTVVRRVNSKLRNVEPAIKEAFLMWNKITVIRNGVSKLEVSPGLVNRRMKEVNLYFER